MPELEILVSKDEKIRKLPDRYVKIILSDKTIINPKGPYFISTETELKFGKIVLHINPDYDEISLGKFRLSIDNLLANISIYNSDILVQMYPNIDTFAEKMGINGQYPKD